MTKTTNYHLNQWVKSDRILMDDFNADNAKLDAAIKAEETARIAAVSAEASARSGTDARKLEFTSIKTVSANLNSATGALSVSVPGVYFPSYYIVVLDIALPQQFTSCMLRPNDCNGMNVSTNPNNSTGGMTVFWGDDPQRVILFPMKNSSALVGGISVGRQPSLGTAVCTYGQLNSFTFSPFGSGTVSGTCTITLSGIK